jgi:hypothetical protein
MTSMTLALARLFSSPSTVESWCCIVSVALTEMARVISPLGMNRAPPSTRHCLITTAWLVIFARIWLAINSRGCRAALCPQEPIRLMVELPRILNGHISPEIG